MTSSLLPAASPAEASPLPDKLPSPLIARASVRRGISLTRVSRPRDRDEDEGLGCAKRENGEKEEEEV